MTTQFPEILLIEGDRIPLISFPPIPQDHPRITKVSPDEVMRENPMLLSSGCWRRYIGVWEIKDDRLFLKALQGIYRLEGEEPLFADWFSGALSIPLRGMLKYFVLGYGAVQQGQMHIRVENGIVVRTLVARPRNESPDAEELTEKNSPKDAKRLEGEG